MALQPSLAASAPISINRPSTSNLGFDPLSFSDEERGIAMDAIAQIIPHLNLQDCRKVAELVDAQATLIKILGDRQAVLPVPLEQYCAA